MSSDSAIRQLKETAKWSDDPEKKKTAIKELTAHGENALTALQEIMNVTVYDEIKAACIDAIKAAREKDSTTAGVSSSMSASNKMTKKRAESG
jgi:basic membrane lipoprotein Med (substrate-binding protein (PBP1-ABC) superfamily)